MPAVEGCFRDSHRVNLRKAGRAAIVVPGLLVVLVATGNDAAALFGSFGAFAALVFADFGGPRLRRLRAYGLLALVGAVLVALGSACSDTVYPAVVATGVIAFLIAFSGALGGYFAAGATSATLAVVLAVMTPVVDADLVAREVGWIAGVLLAGIAAVVLWPAHERDRVREAAAQVLRAAARCLREPAATRDQSVLRAADTELGRRAGVVYRPAGSITRERALVAVVVGARGLPALVDAVTTAERSNDADPSPEYVVLVECITAALDVSARIASGDREAGVDVEAAIRRARAAHSEALDQWAGRALLDTDSARVVGRFLAVFPTRRLALTAAGILRDAHDAEHDVVRSRAAGEAMAVGTWAALRAHCNVRSVRFRNAARAGLGLALAVLVAKSASVQHAFWVVLGALSVLRSNALGTGATALQAFAGALIGFGVATAVMLTFGGDDLWLWLLLPVVTFLAAYTPAAVNFVVGQGAFTVFVVVLFNVIVPQGWRTGLVRVQDVAIGAGIAVMVGALVWPRGAHGVARRAFADLLRAANAHLSTALDAALRGADGDVELGAANVTGARDRATAALADLALERGGGHVDRQGWAALLVDGSALELAADGIIRVRSVHGVPEGCADTRRSLEAEGRVVTAGVERYAQRLEDAGLAGLDATAPVPVPVPSTLAPCLAGHVHDGLHRMLGLVWIHEWLALAGDRHH